MSLPLLYDAVVQFAAPKELVIVFTSDGAREVTDERFAAFDHASGARLSKVPTEHGLRIEGYVCEDPGEPLVSMWAVAVLVHEHFGYIEVDVHLP
jgi:hypothetical protein